MLRSNTMLLVVSISASFAFRGHYTKDTAFGVHSVGCTRCEELDRNVSVIIYLGWVNLEPLRILIGLQMAHISCECTVTLTTSVKSRIAQAGIAQHSTA